MQVVWAGSKDKSLNTSMKIWAAEHIWPGSAQTFGNCVCMGVMDGLTPVACMVFHNWEPSAGVIEVSGAAVSKRWITRPVLAEMFGYAFNTCKAQMVVMRVSAEERQKHLHRILQSYGFKSYLIPRLGGRDEDLTIFTLTDDDWRGNKFNHAK